MPRSNRVREVLHPVPGALLLVVAWFCLAAGVTLADPLAEAMARQQVLVANADQLLAVASWAEPAFWPELVDRYYELTLRAGNRRALAKRFQQMLVSNGEHIKTLKQPTLVLWGGKDRLIPPENGREFARDIAGSRLVIFDDLGHVPQEEDAGRTVAEFRRFLGLSGSGT